jgi:hypothetical protein
MSDVLREQEPALDLNVLRQAIQEEYNEVASHPHKGFHFHTGRPLARMLEYRDEWLEGIPESSPLPAPAILSAWASLVLVRGSWTSAAVQE